MDNETSAPMFSTFLPTSSQCLACQHGDMPTEIVIDLSRAKASGLTEDVEGQKI